MTMSTQIALPPLPDAPAANASQTVWDAYLAIAKLHRQIAREDEYDAEMARHHAAVEASAGLQAQAFTASANAAARQADSSSSLVANDLVAEARRRADWIISGAFQIFVDRSTASSSAVTRQKLIADSVADAAKIVDSVLTPNSGTPHV